jgi:hypothetical protein
VPGRLPSFPRPASPAFPKPDFERLGRSINSAGFESIDFDRASLPDDSFAPLSLPKLETPEALNTQQPLHRRGSGADGSLPIDSLDLISLGLPAIPADGRSISMTSEDTTGMPVALSAFIPTLGNLDELTSDPQIDCVRTGLSFRVSDVRKVSGQTNASLMHRIQKAVRL